MRIDNPEIQGIISLEQDSTAELSGSFTGSFSGSFSGDINATSVDVTGLGFISSSEQIATEISGAFTESSSSFSTRVTDLETFSSSLDTTFATDSELSLVSSSIVSTITSDSSSFSTRVTTNETDISNLQTDSGSFSTRVTDLETFSSSLDTTFATDSELSSVSASLASDITTNDSRLDTLEGKTLVSSSIQIDHDQTTNFVSNEHIDHSSVTLTAGDGLSGGGDITTNRSFAVDSTVVRTSDSQSIGGVKTFTDDNQFTGTQYFDSIAVSGTGSFAYIESITGSAKIIGDAYIILNANSPAERYAGIKVIDSGSTDTGSLEYDSVNNHWFYESTTEGYASGIISGPRDTRGAITWPTNNTIIKGIGSNHVDDSNITDDGSTITLDSTLYVTGSNVGIGTTAPTTELDVVGTANFTGSLLVTGSLSSNILNLSNSTSTQSRIQGPNDNSNYFIGTSNTGRSLTTGLTNIGIGPTTLRDLTDGDYNVLVGPFAGFNLNGNNNVGVGNSALGNIGNGSNNIGIGFATFGNISASGGSNRIAIGYAAGANAPGNKGIYIGYQAGQNISSGNGNVVIGGNNGSTISGTSNNVIIADGDGNIKLQFNSSNNAHFTGSVGIGTTNASYRLQVADTGLGGLTASFGSGVVRIGGSVDNTSNQVLSIAPGVVGVDAPGVPNGRFIINGSGNVGIGTTNVSYKLDVNGTGRFSGGDVRVISGTTANTGQINFGLSDFLLGYDSSVFKHRIWDGADYFTAIQYDGPNLRLILAPSEGNVGIGTTSPGAKLQIQADGIGLRLDGTPNTTRTIFIRNTSSTNPAQIYSDGSLRLYTEDAGTDIRFHTVSNGSNNERMRIDSSGNVGIGTTRPDNKLHVDGNIQFGTWTTAGSRYIGFGRDNNGGFGTAGASGIEIESGTFSGNGNYDQALHFWTHIFNGGSGRRMTITYDGKVGIGTTSPVSKLEVFTSDYNGITLSRTVQDGGSLINSRSYDTSNVLRYSNRIVFGSTAGASRADGFIAFVTANADTLTERMRITSGGNVGIGTTSPYGKLELNGSGNSWATAPAIRMWDSTNSKGWLVGNVNNITAGDFYIRTLPSISGSPSSSQQEFTIKHSSGNVGIGTASPQEKLHIFNNSPSWDQYATIRLSTESDSYASEVGFHRGTSTDVDRGLFLSGDGTNKHLHVNYTGNVGIGTTSPGAKLDVIGTIKGALGYTPGVAYSRTSSPGSSITFDTGIVPNSSQIFEVFFAVNPNTGGSAEYRTIGGYLVYVNGEFSSPNVVYTIRESQLFLQQTAGLGITITFDAVFWNGSTENTSIPVGSAGSNEIRIKIGGSFTTLTYEQLRIRQVL